MSADSKGTGNKKWSAQSMNPNGTFSVKDYALDRIRTYWRMGRYYKDFMWANRDLFKKTAALRGIHQGSSAFVFGCGPSVNTLDMKKIKKYQKEQGFKIYAVNAYITSENSLEAVPDYYILSDPRALGHPKDEKDRQTAKIVWERLTNNRIPLFVPADLHGNVEYQNKYIFCDQENLFSRNVTDLLRPRGFISLTVLKAVQIALFLGHEKIYICGVDHADTKSLHVGKDNKLVYEEPHFYDAKNKTARMVVENINMTEMFYLGFLGFESFNRFAGHPIINLNPESFVDCYSKEHPLDVYKKS
jgi:hypothetical protein